MPLDGPTGNQRYTLTSTEMAIALRACLAVRQPACVHGAVGIGKTQTIEQMVASIGATSQVEPISRRDPTDYSGVPMPDVPNKRTVWCEPIFWHLATMAALAHPDLPHVVFWDEYNRALVATQNVSLNIILANQSGEYTLPANVCHILAVNDAADSTGVTGLSEAARNRVVHLYQIADFVAFKGWAVSSPKASATTPTTRVPFEFAAPYSDNATGRIKPEVLAYLNNHPEHLHDYTAANKKADAFPTPRSWEFLSRVISPDLPPAVERALICGSIGVPVGTQFIVHLHAYRTLVGHYDIPAILASPTTAAIPPTTDASSLYAVSSALSRLMTPANATAALAYLARLPNEYQAFAVLSAIRRTGTAPDFDDSPLHAVGAVNNWKIAHQDMF